MVAARLLRLSVSPSLRASPRCAAETRSERTSPLMRTAETRSKRTSPLMRIGCVSVAARRVVSCLSAPGLRSNAV